MKCVQCGNEDHETLQFFSVYGITGREVHVCNKCKNYLKVLNTKEIMPEKDLTMEDIKTLYLDILTEKEGFNKNQQKS